MIGCIAIDFRPGDGAIPRILQAVDREGFPLRGIRLIPCDRVDRSTLRLDVGGARDPELLALERRLLALEGTIEVIHQANGAARSR